MVKFVIIFCLFWTATMGYIVWHNLEENRTWGLFLSDHGCRPLSEIRAKSYRFGVTFEEKPVTAEPYRKCWICDAGIQYCR
ncbi:MAG TPA: hypothetical protein PKA14_17085 [Leptospiraceae bacterium]|nr:hypothetical protein [Leptospiraceae bacterium]